MRRTALTTMAAVVACAAGASTAHADGLVPTATTLPATVTTFHACLPDGTMTFTFNGTVNPNGQDTTWSFEYGPTTAYGSMMPAQDAGARTTDVAVSQTLTNAPFGTLHFRLVATNASGPTDGIDQTITEFVPPCPALGIPAVAYLPHGPIVSTGGSQCHRPPGAPAPTFSVGLAASVTSSPPFIADTAAAHFVYGPTTAYGDATASVPFTWWSDTPQRQTVTATASGLGHLTHYALVLTDSYGSTIQSNDATLAIPVPPCPALVPFRATVPWSLIAFSARRRTARLRFRPPCWTAAERPRVTITRHGRTVRITLRVRVDPRGYACAHPPAARTITVPVPRGTRAAMLREGAS